MAKKMFSLVNIFGLALGMAACLSIFYYVSYEFSYEKFFTDSDQIYRVYLERKQGEKTTVYSTPGTALQPKIEEFNEVKSSFRLVTIDYQNNSLIYDNDGNKKIIEQTGVNYTDGSIGKTLDLKLASGSFIAMEEPMKMVLTESVANKFFNASAAIGKIITLSGNIGSKEYEVVGVIEDLPQNTDFNLSVLLSMPSYDVVEGKGSTEKWNNWNARTFLKSKTPLKTIQASLNKGMIDTPLFEDKESKWSLNFLPLEENHLTSITEDNTIDKTAEKTLLGLALIGVFILTIAWINFINLSTTRAMERAREVGLRKVLGSQVGQIRLQFIVESFTINLIAAILAFTIVQLSMPLLQDIANPMIIPNGNYFTFWVVVCTFLIGGSFLSGLYPAFYLSSFKPVTTLKGKFSSTGKGSVLRKGLVSFQFMASTLMITGTYIVYQQITFMKNKDLGVNIDNIVLLDSPPSDIHSDDDSHYKAVNAFKEEVLQLNAISKMSVSGFVPGEPIGWATALKRPQDEDKKPINLISCDQGFVDTFGLELAAGRFYQQGDATFGKGDFVINEQALSHFDFKTAEEAIGQKLIGARMFPELTIVGVVKDFHQQSLKSSIVPCGFVLSTWSSYYSLALNIDTTLPMDQRAIRLKNDLASVENVWKKFFPDAPFDFTFLDEKFDAQYKSDREFGSIVTLFAVISIIIAGLGLFGLSSYSVIQRTKEIGIRKILGASLTKLFYLLTAEYIILISIAATVSIPIAYYAMQSWLNNYTYHISIGWWMITIPIIFIIGIALLTVGSQVLKVAKKNPIDSLRYE